MLLEDFFNLPQLLGDGRERQLCRRYLSRFLTPCEMEGDSNAKSTETYRNRWILYATGRTNRSLRTYFDDRHVPAREEHADTSFLFWRAVIGGKIDAAPCAPTRRFVEENGSSATINRKFGNGQAQSSAAA